jgi:hypothetical protein
MATAADAELVLKLYELRREPRMRQARHWVVNDFNPKNLDELLAVQRDFGSDQNQMWRQVIGYWEMAAALVLAGALDRVLFLESNGENLFLLAKFGLLNDEYAQTSGTSGFMPKMAALVSEYEPARKRVESLREALERA